MGATLRNAGVLLACLVLGGVLSVVLGQDANWDLRNYHLYNAWALFHGRWEVDLFAAGIQSYFNPLLDIPYYWLAWGPLEHYPRRLSFLMGLPFGLLAFAAWSIARTVVRDLPLRSPRPGLLPVCAAAFGLSGVASVSQLGTTFNEIQVAAMILVGVMCLLYALADGLAERNRYVAVVLAGAVFGLAAGAKLTAAIYAPAAVLGLLWAGRGLGRGLAQGIVFSFAWMAGFAVTYGWWGIFLYRQTGNPVFPFFESVFHTGLTAPASIREMRFMPKTAMETLFYPFRWVDDSVLTVADVAFKDPRGAVAYSAVIFGVLCLLGKKLSAPRGSSGEQAPLAGTVRFVLVFCAAAFLIWQAFFSILRYLVPVEALLGVLVLIAVAVPVARASGREMSGGVLALLVAGLTLAAAAFTRYPEWGRLPHAPPTAELVNVELPPHSLVLAWAPPQAYAMPFIERANPGTQFLGLTGELLSWDQYALWARWKARVRAHQGPLFILAMPAEEPFPWPERLGELGLSIDTARCQRFSARVTGERRLCPLTRSPAGTDRP